MEEIKARKGYDTWLLTSTGPFTEQDLLLCSGPISDSINQLKGIQAIFGENGRTKDGLASWVVYINKGRKPPKLKCERLGCCVVRRIDE